MRSINDYYSKRAKAEGYPARSVYKLEEIQRRFQILRKGMRVLDLGASPGSWSLYTAKIVGRGGSIIAVDLQDKFPSIKETQVTFLSGDIYDEALTEKLKSFSPYDCITSDAAPTTTGNRTVDTLKSAALAERVIYLGCQLLKPGGNLVVKIYQGADQQKILGTMRTQFNSAKQIKPKASRNESFEVFCVGTNYRGE